MRLASALAALDRLALERLCRRRHVVLEGRRPAAEEAARQLADRAREVRVEALPEPTRDAAHRLATQAEGASRVDLGGGALPLIEEDLIFEVGDDLLAMPSAYRATLPPWPDEPRDTARALLAVQPPRIAAELGAHALGRRPEGPAALWLEPVLEALEAPGLVLDALAPSARRLLDSILRVGDGLTPATLRALDGTGGDADALVARGLLLTRASRWVVPREVARELGSWTSADASTPGPAVEAIACSAFVAMDDAVRARISSDPGVRALLSPHFVAGGVLIRQGVSRGALAAALRPVGFHLSDYADHSQRE